MPTPEHGPWSGPPRGVAGRSVTTPAMVARSDRATVAVVAVRAFPDGVEFDVVAAATSPATAPHELYADSMARAVAGRTPDVVLRFAVRLADGTTAATVDTPVAPLTRPDRHVLWRLGGSGDHIDGPRITTRPLLWLWPSPPPGPLLFSTEWPAFGIGVTAWELEWPGP